MNSSCIFCAKPLGANDIFETFPVGKRFAIDSARGRLWVICPRCERWNLTPLEERWDAIEQAERLYRETRELEWTENIGFARIGSATTLVRIGQPSRAELAAWRYGDQFAWRRRREMIAAGTAPTSAIVERDPRAVVARVRTQAGEILAVPRSALTVAIIGQGRCRSLMLHLAFLLDHAHYEGREAERVAAVLVPKLNRAGGGLRRTVRLAVDKIERGGGTRGFLDALTSRAAAQPHPVHLSGLSPAQLLALEMTLHEEAERRATAGESAALERAWQDAEEIALVGYEIPFPDRSGHASLKFKLGA